MISFNVPGPPCAKQSVRFTRTGRTYQPADVLAYHDKIGWYARQAYAGMLEGPIRLDIKVCFIKPQSWSKKRKNAERWHAQRPDIDNIIKALFDGLKGVIIKDDAQISKISVEKFWTDAETGLSVSISSL